MKKIKVITAIATVLAICSANIEAGYFSDLAGTFRPVISKIAAWRPLFMKMRMVNSSFQELHALERANLTCAHYRKAVDSGQSGEVKWVKETQADSCCMYGGPRKVVAHSVINDKKEISVVAMCPTKNCGALSIHNIGKLKYCDLTNRWYNIPKVSLRLQAITDQYYEVLAERSKAEVNNAPQQALAKYTEKLNSLDEARKKLLATPVYRNHEFRQFYR